MKDFDNVFDHFDAEIFEDGSNLEYTDYLDAIPPSKMEIEFVAECVNCGEQFMEFEVEMNKECPVCNAMLRKL